MILFVNFGGPRNLDEIRPFLEELLTDRDVIPAKTFDFLHDLFFRYIAKKRSIKMRQEYASLGGGSPIFADTERLAELFGENTMTFHRYLPALHAEFCQKMSVLNEEITVFPLFPQFSYATTGSVARWFRDHLPQATVEKLRFIRSYSDHPAFVAVTVQLIREKMGELGLLEEETVLLFSAHGLPQSFVDTGDPYEEECNRSFNAVIQAFPKALSRLSYQSKFGRAEWLKPYTEQICKEVKQWACGYKNVLVVPISFTSDHIETLYEIEQLYLPLITAQGLVAYRVCAPNCRQEFVDAIGTIISDTPRYKIGPLIKM